MIVPGRGSVRVLGVEDDGRWTSAAEMAVEFFNEPANLQKLQRCLLGENRTLASCDVFFMPYPNRYRMTQTLLQLAMYLALAMALEGTAAPLSADGDFKVVAMGEVVPYMDGVASGQLIGSGATAGDVDALRHLRFKKAPKVVRVIVPACSRKEIVEAIKQWGKRAHESFLKKEKLYLNQLEVRRHSQAGAQGEGERCGFIDCMPCDCYRWRARQQSGTR